MQTQTRTVPQHPSPSLVNKILSLAVRSTSRLYRTHHLLETQLRRAELSLELSHSIETAQNQDRLNSEHQFMKYPQRAQLMLPLNSLLQVRFHQDLQQSPVSEQAVRQTLSNHHLHS